MQSNKFSLKENLYISKGEDKKVLSASLFKNQLNPFCFQPFDIPKKTIYEAAAIP